MTDVLQRLSAEVARNPSGSAWVPLTDTLRQRGQLDAARLVALRGLERHPHAPEAHDALARVYADSGDAARARDEWEMALQLMPDYVPARKGLGFLAFREGDVVRAAEWLASAVALAPDDRGLGAALARVRARVPGTSRSAGRRASEEEITEPYGHASVAADHRPVRSTTAEQDERIRLALRADGDGLLLWSGVQEGESASGDRVAAHATSLLAGATHAMERLGLGSCMAIVAEGTAATCALERTASGGVAVIGVTGTTPLGRTRELLAQLVRNSGDLA